jgi:intracellular multiplication protein IcmD
MRFMKKMIVAAVAITALLCGIDVLAAGSYVTLKTIASNVGSSVHQLSVMLQDLSLIAGIGFIMASFFKFHQHKLNPTQVPMSQGVTLLVIGGGLTLFPILLPTAGTAVIGSNATFATIAGSQISSLVGGGS